MMILLVGFYREKDMAACRFPSWIYHSWRVLEPVILFYAGGGFIAIPLVGVVLLALAEAECSYTRRLILHLTSRIASK
jgi:hypothetical protein